jgi:hypothetical protein
MMDHPNMKGDNAYFAQRRLPDGELSFFASFGILNTTGRR